MCTQFWLVNTWYAIAIMVLWYTIVIMVCYWYKCKTTNQWGCNVLSYKVNTLLYYQAIEIYRIYIWSSTCRFPTGSKTGDRETVRPRVLGE